MYPSTMDSGKSPCWFGYGGSVMSTTMLASGMLAIALMLSVFRNSLVMVLLHGRITVRAFVHRVKTLEPVLVGTFHHYDQQHVVALLGA